MLSVSTFDLLKSIQKNNYPNKSIDEIVFLALRNLVLNPDENQVITKVDKSE